MERVMGLEPITVCLEGRDSSHWATPARDIELKLTHSIKTLPLVKTFSKKIPHDQWEIFVWDLKLIVRPY